MIAPGCLACELSEGARELPGGLIHETSGWRVEHCVGPLGLGTLIVKPKRHVVHLSELTPEESVEMGPLLHLTAAVVEEVSRPQQVYVCLWSHGPVHIHFVVQPETEEAIQAYGAFGPRLQAAMFSAGSELSTDRIVEIANAARVAFAREVRSPSA